MAIWLGRLPVYESMVRQRFEAAGLPSDLVYLGLIESGYSNVAVSRSRATGMWQFMRGTGRWIGLRIDRWVDERRDPVKATDAAARYLQMLTAQFGGSHFLAAAAYNAGPGKVSRGLTRMGPVVLSKSRRTARPPTVKTRTCGATSISSRSPTPATSGRKPRTTSRS